jgi:DNA-binding SARP family transcriptional activator
MDSPRLRVLLLGPPVVTWDGQPCKFTRRQQRAGLFYLACQTVPVARATVSHLFWPLIDEDNARKILREGLSKLRADLPDPSIILSDNGTLFLDPAKVYVDIKEYTTITDPLLSSSEMASAGKLPSWMYSKMIESMRLCRGNHFLQSVSLPKSSGFENWAAITDRGYEYTRQKIVERLAHHCIAIGNLDEALLWLGKYTQTDPTNNEINFLILNCLKDQGRYKDALDYISYLENLHLSTTDEILPREILNVRKRIIEASKTFQIEKQNDWPGSELHPTRFIGRVDLLNRLQHALNRKGIVSIKGESGSGKTRLVQEFYNGLPMKPRLLFCIGKPMVKCSPFEPLIEGLRATVKPEEWLSLSDQAKKNLSLLFPELETGLVEEHEILSFSDVENDLLSLYDSLHTIFKKLAEKRQLLLVIDIVQWCDEATIGFLSYLSDREFFKKHGLFIMISRREEVNPAIETFIDRNTITNLLEKIDLPPLSFEETRQLIQSIVGRKTSEYFQEKIYRDTGGNPFFLIEGLKTISDIQIDLEKFDEGTLYPIPSTVHSLVNERIRILSDSAKLTLQAAAVLGQYFSPETLERMGELPEKDLIFALEELQAASILSIGDGFHPQSGYAFPHDQIREVVLRNLTPLRKRQLHLKAVNALITAHGELLEQASIYAYHYSQAGEPVEAFEAWMKAGQFARSRYSKTDTYFAYQQAFDLIPKIPTNLISDMVYRLVVEWGDYANDTTDIQTCEKIYKTCLDLGEKTQDSLLLGTGFSGHGRIAGMKFQIEEGVESLDRAMFYFERIQNKGEICEVLTRKAILLVRKDDLANAKTGFQKAIQLIEEPQTQREMDAMVDALSHLGLIYVFTGWPIKAEQVAMRAVNISELVKRRSAKVQAMSTLALAQHYSGKFNKSINTAQEIYSLAGKLNLRWWYSLLDTVLARNYFVMGLYDQCLNHTSLAAGREKQDPTSTIYSYTETMMGDIHLTFGDLATAEQHYIKGSELGIIKYHALENKFLLGLTQILQDNKNEGMVLLEAAIQSAEKFDLGLIFLRAKMVRLMFRSTKASTEQYLSERTNLIVEMQKRGFAIPWSIPCLLPGTFVLEKANLLEAKKYFAEVVETAKEQGNIWSELQAYRGMINNAECTKEEIRQIQKRVTELLSIVAINTRQQPVKKLFTDFRKNWPKNN